MFNNLIESSSHRQELKRRGSFFLFTTLTYALMVAVGGIASIYAYDARLAEQNYEQVITMLPPEPAPVTPDKPTVPDKPRGDNNKPAIAEREVAMLSTNRPERPPDMVSAQPNKVPPLPDGPVRITDRNWDPPVQPGGGNSAGSGGARIIQPRTVILEEDPPPPPVNPPTPKIVRSTRVLNSEAIRLPVPPYPMLAKRTCIQGKVNIQVLIDEEGRVISAQIVSGHAMLTGAAREAAMQARFSPTMIGDQPVKVSGVIIYNFVLNQ